MQWVLMAFYGLTHSYGLAIILLTVAVRIVIIPLYHGQLRYMRKMQELQPEMKRLQAKYKGEPQKLNQEMMDLYKRVGTNPLSGCLPMVVQLPILYALYDGLIRFHWVGSTAFLWIPNLAHPDPIYILPVLVAGTTLWQTLVTMPRGTVEKSQQLITYVMMPALLLYVSLRYASALSLYWVVAALFTIAQSYISGVGRPHTPVARVHK